VVKLLKMGDLDEINPDDLPDALGKLSQEKLKNEILQIVL
jgi:glycosylphosphatidylinositol transamidase (GPIT) subunit GPI8